MRKPTDVGFMARRHSPESPIHEQPYPVTGEDIDELLASPIEDERKRRVLMQWRERLEARLHQPEPEAVAAPGLNDILGRVMDAFRRMGPRR